MRNIGNFVPQIINNDTDFGSGPKLDDDMMLQSYMQAPRSTTNNDQYGIMCGSHELNSLFYRIRLGYNPGTPETSPFDDIEIVDSRSVQNDVANWGPSLALNVKCRAEKTVLQVTTASNSRFVKEFLNPTTMEVLTDLTPYGINYSFPSVEFHWISKTQNIQELVQGLI